MVAAGAVESEFGIQDVGPVARRVHPLLHNGPGEPRVGMIFDSVALVRIAKVAAILIRTKNRLARLVFNAKGSGDVLSPVAGVDPLERESFLHGFFAPHRTVMGEELAFSHIHTVTQRGSFEGRRMREFRHPVFFAHAIRFIEDGRAEQRIIDLIKIYAGVDLLQFEKGGKGVLFVIAICPGKERAVEKKHDCD